jgi:E3 ubiquitin-protein ligase HERC4
MQPSLGKSLQELLDYQEENFEEMFALNFQITRRYFGEVQTVDLVPDGANKPVTKANRQDYVEAYVDYLLNKSVANQFTAFYHGFKIVCNSSVLVCFFIDVNRFGMISCTFHNSPLFIQQSCKQ